VLTYPQAAALNHPLFKVTEVQFRVVGGKPDEIIPIPPLHPALPLSTETSVHLAGKEIGKRKGPHRKRDWLKNEFTFGVESRRRVSIHLDLYLYDLASRDSADQLLGGFYGQ